MALAIWKIAYPLRLACSAKAATTRRTVTGRLSSFTALRLPSLTAAEAEQSLDGAGGEICVNRRCCVRGYHMSGVTYVSCRISWLPLTFSGFSSNLVVQLPAHNS